MNSKSSSFILEMRIGAHKLAIKEKNAHDMHLGNAGRALEEAKAAAANAATEAAATRAAIKLVEVYEVYEQANSITAHFDHNWKVSAALLREAIRNSASPSPMCPCIACTTPTPCTCVNCTCTPPSFGTPAYASWAGAQRRRCDASDDAIALKASTLPTGHACHPWCTCSQVRNSM